MRKILQITLAVVMLVALCAVDNIFSPVKEAAILGWLSVGVLVIGAIYFITSKKGKRYFSSINN